MISEKGKQMARGIKAVLFKNRTDPSEGWFCGHCDQGSPDEPCEHVKRTTPYRAMKEIDMKTTKKTAKGKTKTTAKKPGKLNLQRAKKRIIELHVQAGLDGASLSRARVKRDEAIEMASHTHQRYMEGRKRIEDLEDHVLDLRGHMDDMWAQIDMLRRMVAGSVEVADGVTAREAARQVIKIDSMTILPNSPKSTDECGA